MINITQHITTIKLLLAAMLPLLAVACSTDGAEPTAIEPQAVVFTPSIARVITRSTLDNEWADGTQIVVCCSEAGKTDKKYTYQYNDTDDKWSAVVQTLQGKYYWPINNPSWSFSAWPASYGNAPKTTMTVAANQSVYSATNTSGIDEATYLGYDLLYCPKTPQTTNETYRQPVELNFLHEMARVVVIVNSSNTDYHETVTNITYGGGHVGLSGQIDTQATTSANATWSLTAGQSSTITMRNRTKTAEAENNQYTFECMLPPQSYATSATLMTITTTCTEYPTRTYNYSNSFTLLAGNQYTYSLSISESGKIVVSSIQVTPWTPVSINGTANYPANSYPSAAVTE